MVSSDFADRDLLRTFVVLEGMRLELPTPFTLTTREGVSFVTCAPLSHDTGMLHAFSTRVGGDSEEPFTALNLGFGSGDERARVQRNRERFAQVVGFSVGRLVTLRQVHSNRVVVLKEGMTRRRCVACQRMP